MACGLLLSTLAGTAKPEGICKEKGDVVYSI